MATMAKGRPRTRRGSLRQREALMGYLFISPYLLSTIVFTIGTILFALYISFNKFNLFTWPPQWVGPAQYLKAFQAEKFRRALVNAFWYFTIVVPVQTSLALALAVMLNVPMRLRQFFRTAFYGPSVTSSVVISMIFWWLYLKTGYLNFFLTNLLGSFGVSFQAVEWLNDPTGLFQMIVQPFGREIPIDYWYLRGPSVTWMAIMFQNIFTTAPTFMIMFLAALQDIPPVLYEAAAIDGATGWRKFWKITLPLLRPVILLIVVLGTIGTLQIFDQVKILTGGGPLNTTLAPVYMIYTETLGILAPPRVGYAAAMAFILTAIIFVFSFLQRHYIEKGTELYY